MTARCENCRYWRGDERQYGFCHRFPPSGEFTASFTEDGYERRKYRVDISRYQNGSFPNISRDEWCGEHSPVEPEKT